MNHPLANRIRKNLKAIKSYIRNQNIYCYRIFDWDMPEYPWCIDCYEDWVHVAEYKTRHTLDEISYRDWVASSLEAIKSVLGINDDKLVIKRRERQKDLTQYEKLGSRSDLLKVREGGLHFLVNLHDYLDTGLFLDHRITRNMVREESAGKHVLNLFAYTGSFSVYAADGGASRVCTVDLSNTYLHWAQQNWELNKFDIKRHQCIRADVKSWLKQQEPMQYELAVLDPPTISRSKMAASKLDVQADHFSLIQDTMNLLKPKGVLYFSTNFRDFRPDPRLSDIYLMEDITLQTIPSDFRNQKIHYAWRMVKA